MAKLYNLARMTTATTGTGTITLGSAVASYVTFANAGVQNGDTVTYAIVDGNNREVGRGVYTSAGTTLTRATILESTNSNAAINLSGNAEVFITAAAEDIANVGETNTFTASQVISVTDNTNAALRVTQLGTGAAIRVEDSTNPDSTPFMVDASGNVIIGNTTALAPLDIGPVNSADEGAEIRFRGSTNATMDYFIDAYQSTLRFAKADKGAATNAAVRFQIGESGQFGIGGATYGTSGQVFTSNGASAAPSWQTPANWEYIAHGVTSGTTNLNFTSLPSTYSTIYAFFIVAAGANSVTTRVLLSSDNGSTYGSNRSISSSVGSTGIGRGWASINNILSSGTNKTITPSFSDTSTLQTPGSSTSNTYTVNATENVITGVINALRFNMNNSGGSLSVILYGTR